MSEENKEIKAEEISVDKWNGDSSWIFILLMLFGFGWNNPENPRITELEKKVARLEGQMSMIGGKFHE